ncbi:MAG: DUF4175 family protein, partial [Myxococcales bacterium]|nr:DUF4175 family protein [Myxococcales bacterium]
LSFVAGGPLGVAAWWMAGTEGGEALAALDLLGKEEQARVGDLVLRYTYPAYTGLEPRVVENSTGDVAGPPGTVVEITARSADALEAAGLVAYDQRYEAQLLDERTIQARLSIGPEDGTYHLVTWRNGEDRDSRDLAIDAQEDLAPEVTVDGVGDVVELAVDEPLMAEWRARDDFGIARVGLRVDGRTAGNPLFRAQERQGEAFGMLRRTPADLGLAAGARVKVELVAFDNDTVAGPKAGVSRTIELVVLGARGVDQRNEAALNELVEAMLGVLAGHLEEPFPVGTTHAELAGWAPEVAKRYGPLEAVVDAEWSRLKDGGMEREVVGAAVKAGSALVTFTAVTFELGRLTPVSTTDLAELQDLRDRAVATLEDAILALDRMRRMRALAEAVDIAERLESLGKDLESMLAEDDPDSLRLLAQLEQLEAMMKQLAEEAAKLDEGGLKEFLNARENEARNLMDEIRKAIAEGRMDEARELSQRLARQLQQLAEGVRDTLERQKGEGDQSMEQAEQLLGEMERLEEEQRKLQEEVRDLQENEGDAAAQKQADLWEQIAGEAFALQDELEDYESELEDASRSFSELQRAGNALQHARQLRVASQLRDYRAARIAHDTAGYALESLRRGLQASRVLSPSLLGPGAEELASLEAHHTRIGELLDQLEQASSSPESAAKAQELQQRQQELEEQLQSVTQKARELTKEFPVRPGEMNERLDEAGKRMKDASDDLGDGRPMPAQGSQGAAADRLREARDALERAMEQAAQQQQQGEGGGSGKDGEGESDPKDRDGGDQNDATPEIEIPGAEAFRTPEEYRRALLEGMEGDVPEEYRALKKRYFEELVRQ